MDVQMPELRTVDITRYVTPLREGGSLPAIVEADDGFLYALKFRGAGQGVKALIAELIGGEIARILGLRIPELVFAMVDPAFGRTEPDEEIQDLLKASSGLNLALHYLSGAITFDPAVTQVEELLASQIVWMDCLLTNVDRTVRNTNMLMWHQELWLIDHGASLYFHHNWDNWEAASLRPFAQVKDHVLLPRAGLLQSADDTFRQLLTPEQIHEVVATIPDDWLTGDPADQLPEEKRAIYRQFLNNRVTHSTHFVKKPFMPDKQLFEYAVIRIVPRVEREEFINVGVVMYVRSKRFLQTMICLDEQRLQILFPGADAGMITTYLVAFQQICQATPGSGPIGKLDTASRFRWLTATRSTVVQTSKVHPGMCAEPETALQRLYEQLVR